MDKTKEEILNTWMDSDRTKESIYKAMQQWSDQENRILKQKLEKIKAAIPEGTDYDPGDVLYRIENIIYSTKQP